MPASHTTSVSPRRHRRGSRTLLRPVAIAAVGVATVAALGGAAAAAPATHPVRVLRYSVEFSPPNVIHVPPLQQHSGDFQPGNYVTFGDKLRDRHGTQVGVEAGSGMIARIDDTTVQVFFTMAVQLAGGQIAAQAIASNAPAKHLAITGGTGAYLHAVGDLELIENGDGTGTLTLTLR